MTPELTAIEVRVLGALIEKEITTPEYYPLTLNSLTLACSQTSNRDPVVSYDEGAVARALDLLREKKLAYLHGGGSGRVPRFGHRLAEVFPMDRSELAIMCVLLLRGPQTLGEIKGRATRMHEFSSLAEAEQVVDGLAARDNPSLVVRLERESGNKEPRYVHRLAPPPPASGTSAVGAAAEESTKEVPGLAALQAELAVLKQEVVDLRAEFGQFRKQFE